MLRSLALALLCAISMLLAACTTSGAGPEQRARVAAPDVPEGTAQSSSGAGLAELVESARIGFDRFVLDNGLVTIVHTDRKAPIVGVTVYYRVGSKHEPRGRTGFAHLFEHLMFVGSENVENYDAPLLAAGSTGPNGSTYYDRTNYVQTVPTGALDLALFMESDRMGYLLGAITQDKLDNQRAVVQNEKRQGDTEPYGLLRYLQTEGLLPVGHPYRHEPIGSMADLEAASLLDVRDWFTSNYGPNNVVLVLAGDIDAATARPMVERWFGAIARGPDVPQVAAEPVPLPAPRDRIVTDQVPLPSVFRMWTGPGVNHPDALPLEIGMAVLGGLQSSRLDNALVRGAELAVRVSASAESLEQIGFVETRVDVKDGVAREQALAALEAETTRLITDGPTLAELDRARTQAVASAIAALEQVGGFGGKGAILAEGELYSGDPGFEHARLQRLAALTPADVQAALQRWLTRPAFTLAIIPGERTLDGAVMGGWGDEDLYPPPPPDEKAPFVVARTAPPRDEPPVEDVAELAFPQVEQATLSNGIKVVLARRTSVPQVTLALNLAAGTVVDTVEGQFGRHRTMIDLLTEGTTTRTAQDLAIAQEELGSTLLASAGIDGDTVFLQSLSTKLAPSLELLADVVRNPAFRADDVARVRAQRLAEVAQERASPGGLANRAFRPLVYGGDHPYARAAAAGDEAVIASLTPDDLAAAHQAWFRPDLATITAVGDVTLAELVAALEQALGDWQAPAAAPPPVMVDQPAPAPTPQLVVIDRPNSPSSFLIIGRATRLTGHAEGIEPVLLASDVLGGGFLSRLNQDLRETKGWTYSIRAAIPGAAGQRVLQISTQVQADRTGDSINAIIAQMRALPQLQPIAADELQRVTQGTIRGLPNSFETNGQVLGALLTNQRLRRELDYQAQLPAIYRTIGAGEIDQAARDYLQPDNLTIVVVGDRQVIDGQLAELAQQLETPITYLAAEEM